MQIYLIGTVHSIQVMVPGSAASAAFRSRLDLWAESLQPEAIAEEMSREALAKPHFGGATATAADVVCAARDIFHLDADPTPAERDALGIREAVNVEAGLGWDIAPEERDERIAEESVRPREREWLRRIEEIAARTIVFICGCDHVQSFQKLAESRGAAVTILSHDWRR